MEHLVIDKNEFTPYVNFDASTKKLELHGRCIPEDAHAFFVPLINWIGGYFESSIQKSEECCLNINCDYYNSASAKMFVYLFDKVAEIQKDGYNFIVTWHCNADDPDLIESVKDYTSITSATIDIKTI